MQDGVCGVKKNASVRVEHGQSLCSKKGRFPSFFWCRFFQKLDPEKCAFPTLSQREKALFGSLGSIPTTFPTRIKGLLFFLFRHNHVDLPFLLRFTQQCNSSTAKPWRKEEGRRSNCKWQKMQRRAKEFKKRDC